MTFDDLIYRKFPFAETFYSSKFPMHKKFNDYSFGHINFCQMKYGNGNWREAYKCYMRTIGVEPYDRNERTAGISVLSDNAENSK